jgi:peptidoglycan hydrolase-like protein with peptidoglycan-binding domain
MVKKTVKELQIILNGLHHQSLTEDGLWGPSTKGAWEKVATAQKLNPGIDRASPKEAWVVPATFRALALQPEPAPAPKSTAASVTGNGRMVPFVIMPKAKPAGEETPRPAARVATKPTAPSKPGLAKKSILELQKMLVTRFAQKLTQDGLYGPSTAAAWGKVATGLGADPVFDRAGPKEAWVSPVTFGALGGAPAPAPAPVRVVGIVTRPVLELQKLLQALGWGKKDVVADGLYGPKTKLAWETSAKKRGVPQTFSRVTGKTAKVADAALVRFQKEVAGRKPLMPKPAAAPAPDPSTVVKTVAELQALLFGVGWTTKKLVADGLYGPQTKRAWGISAKIRNLPMKFARVDGRNARVAKSTYAKIKADAQAAGKAPKPEPAPAPKPAPTTPVEDEIATAIKKVSVLQALLHGLGWTKQKIVPDGLFGPVTKTAWAKEAKARKSPPMFERVDGRHARVSQRAFRKIQAAVAAKGPAPAPAPKPGVPAEPPPIGGAWQSLPPGSTVEKKVKGLQEILRALGWRATTVVIDGLYGPKTEGAWKSSAEQRELNGKMWRISRDTVRVIAPTYTRLAQDAAAAKKPAPAPVPSTPTAPGARVPRTRSRRGSERSPAARARSTGSRRTRRTSRCRRRSVRCSCRRRRRRPRLRGA